MKEMRTGFREDASRRIFSTVEAPSSLFQSARIAEVSRTKNSGLSVTLFFLQALLLAIARELIGGIAAFTRPPEGPDRIFGERNYFNSVAFLDPFQLRLCFDMIFLAKLGGDGYLASCGNRSFHVIASCFLLALYYHVKAI
jgi:hypothetical protein